MITTHRVTQRSSMNSKRIFGHCEILLQVINKAIVGLGTDEDSLTRAIVSRAEIDTMKIREEYSKMFKSNLDEDVIGDTSGDYKDILMILLGAKV